MKQNRKRIVAGILSLLLVLCLVPTVQAEAADHYTITYRAGNVGTFDVAKWTASLTGDGYDLSQCEITENYMKIAVDKGAAVPAFNQTEWLANTTVTDASRYFVLSVSQWGPADSAVVEKNTEYVVDYGTLIDPVQYRIEFTDAQSGEAVAAPVIGYGNEGDTVICSPVQLADYNTDGGNITLTLKAGEENSVAFSYTSTVTPEVNVVEEVITTTTTTTTTVPDTTTPAGGAPAGTTPGGVAPAAGDTTTIPDANVPLADNPDGTDTQDNQDTQDTEAEGGVTTIEDEETPLSDGSDIAKDDTESESDVTTIEDEETPLADTAPTQEKGYLLPIAAMLFVVAAATALVILFMKRKKKIDIEDDQIK